MVAYSTTCSIFMTSTPIPNSSQADPASEVDVLILGAGWLWHFLRPILDSRGLSYGATTRTGHVSGTIAWTLGVDGVEVLPKARTVAITFPVLDSKVLEEFVRAYERGRECAWILLGSTRGWQVRLLSVFVPPPSALDIGLDLVWRFASRFVVFERSQAKCMGKRVEMVSYSLAPSDSSHTFCLSYLSIHVPLSNKICSH